MCKHESVILAPSLSYWPVPMGNIATPPPDFTMRILLISGSLPPMRCGVGDYTASLATALGRCDDTAVAVLTDTAANPGTA
jgi:hypothetical protein